MLTKKRLTDAQIGKMMIASRSPQIMQRLRRIRRSRLLRVIGKVEPQVRKLLHDAGLIHKVGPGVNDGYTLFYSGGPGHESFKGRLVRLVGFAAKGPEQTYLGTPDAYDLVYDAVLSALVPCETCSWR